MIVNRKARRRARALARKAGQAHPTLEPTSGDRPRNAGARWRAALLGTTAAGALALAAPGPARAQTVVPPSNGPCVVAGTTVTCTGDLSAGVDVNAPLTVLNVNNLIGNIAPGAGIDGINFNSAGSISIVSDTGGFLITTTGDDAEGISGISTGAGSVTVTQRGDVTTTGDRAEAIEADALAGGSVTVSHEGKLSTTGNLSEGIDVYIDSYISGVTAVTVTQTGMISTLGDYSEGIDVYASDGGDVTVTQTGTITTIGARAEGIEVDAYGGSVTVTQTGDISTHGPYSEGIEAEADGGGSVTITQTGTVSTTGNSSDAIEAYADDGGSVTIIKMGNISTAGSLADGIDAMTAGNGAISIRSIGRIATQGPNANGILASAGNGAVSVMSMGDISTQGANSTGISGYSVAGAVTITSEGDISNTGNDSYGIFAQSINSTTTVTSTGNITADATGIDARGIAADTTVVSIGNITVTGSASNQGILATAANAGNVSVTSAGNISIQGNNAVGIVTLVAAGNSATINLQGGVIQGGSGTGAGISLFGAAGVTNTLNTSGLVTLSSLGGTAVNAGNGNTTINNFGTLNTVTNGAIELGGGTNAFNNMGGGIFNSGGIVNLGAGNLFSNSGTLSPGGSGARQTTAITGNLVQNGGGIFLATVDPSAGTGDLVTVTGTANLSGIVQAEAINPVTGTRSVTILSAAGGTTNNGLGLLASPALQASLSFPNANDVVLTYSIDFSVGGLNPNQTALANGLNAAANTGTRGLDPVLLPLLNNVFTIGDYRNALNQLLPEVYLNSETASLFASEDFVENLFSCRLAGQNHTALSEGECYWARPQGRFLDRDSDPNTIGFDETSGGLAAGAQVAVAPNWFAGFALGYERASLDTDTGAETDTNRFSGGVSLKYQAGSFLLGAAISGGVSGNDTERPISIGGAGGFNATAESNYAIKTLTGQARAAYVFQLRDWFAKPLVDVTATYLSRDGVTESGAGAANLAIAGSDETFFSVTPALEIGGDFALSETSVIRPYVRAGVSYYTDSDHGLTASFVNASAGTSAFSITSDFDDVFADVAAGATAFFDNGSSLGLAYEGLISSDTQQHAISMKGTWRF